MPSWRTKLLLLFIGLPLLLGSCLWTVSEAQEGPGGATILGLVVSAVGLLMVLIGVSEEPADPATELKKATLSWTAPTIIRSYKNDERGLAKANEEARILATKGYLPATQGGDGGHVNIGRTFTGAVLTGGISLLFGGSRTAGNITIAFVRDPRHKPPAPSRPRAAPANPSKTKVGYGGHTLYICDVCGRENPQVQRCTLCDSPLSW